MGSNDIAKTILLVEDEAIIALAGAMTLKRYGCHVLTAESGERAIELALTTPDIELILMDIDLGKNEMDGTQAAQHILQQRDLPLIFLSNHTEREVVEKTEGITSYGYIVKNSGETVLIASIKMAFKLHAAHQALQQMNESLRIERDRNQRYLNTMQTTMVALDIQGYITMVNRAGCQLLGYAEAELLGRHWFATCLPQPEGMKVVYRIFQQTVAGEITAVEHFENQVRCKDGSTRLIRWHNNFLRDEAGQMVGVLSSGEDITGQKQAEDALSESQAVIKHILDTVPQAIFWKDRQGVYLGCNLVFARACGLANTDQIIGKTDFDLPWSRAEAEAYRADDRQVIESGVAKLHIIEPLQQANGARLWIDTSKVPLLDDRQQIRGVLGIYQDITGSEQFADALAKAFQGKSGLQSDP